MSGEVVGFDPSVFGPVFGPWLAVQRIPELGPGSPEESKRSALEQAAKSGFAHLTIKQPLAAKAFVAGLWLLFDFQDESHEISQSLPDEWGAHWHGIMHRREPDPGNAAYWFRRVRNNRIESSLKTIAVDFGYDHCNSFDFIQDCERHRGTGSELELHLRAIQLAEIRLLLRDDFSSATGMR